jgi:hypothetical protein
VKVASSGTRVVFQKLVNFMLLVTVYFWVNETKIQWEVFEKIRLKTRFISYRLVKKENHCYGIHQKKATLESILNDILKDKSYEQINK